MKLEKLLKNTKEKKKFSKPSSLKSSLRKNFIYALTVPMFFFATSCEPEEEGDFGPDPPEDEETDNGDNEDESSSDTYVFSEEDAKKISNYSYESGDINFSESQDKLSEGDYIASGISDATPDGMLAKITGLSSDKTSAETQPASIKETGETGSVEFSKKLSPENAKVLKTKKGVSRLKSSNDEGFDYQLHDVILYDADGSTETMNDQITVDGYLSFSYELGGDIDVGANSTYISLSAFTKKSASLEVKSEISENIDERYCLRSIKLPSFPVGTIGAIPVTLTPKVDVYIGTKGEFSVEGRMRVKQHATAYGEVYYDNGIGTSKNLTNDFEFDSPELSSEVDLKGYGGPRATLLLWGIAGPHLETHGYGKLEAETQGDKLNWSLYGGLELLAGGNLSGISKDLPELNEKIIDYKKELSSGSVDFGGGDDSEGKIVYSVRNEAQDRYHIATINPDGSDKTEFDLGVWNIEPSWFPDGEEIIYTSYDGWGDYDTYKVNKDGSNKREVIKEGKPRYPTISPTDDFGDNYIAYVKDSTIWVAGSEGSYPNNITTEKRDYKDLHWSHYNGGNNIYFVATSDDVEGVPEPSDKDIYKINSSTHEITKIVDREYDPVAQPEVYNNKLIFSSIDAGGSWEIYTSDINGNNRKQVTNLSGTQSWPTWGSDGTEIYFISNGDIWKKDLESSTIEQLTNSPDRKATSPDYINK